jgi:hypothetical protein
MQVFSKDTIEKVVVFSMVADGEVFYFWSLLQKMVVFSSVDKDGGIWSKYVSIISYVSCHIIDDIYMFYAHFMSYSCIFWN